MLLCCGGDIFNHTVQYVYQTPQFANNWNVTDNTMYCIAPAANCNTVAMNNDKQGGNIIYYIWLI